MYKVFDNNKDADCNHHKVHRSWSNCTFRTLKEARLFAARWLGQWAPDETCATLKPNVPYDYSGYGDMIEIRELNKDTEEKK